MPRDESVDSFLPHYHMNGREFGRPELPAVLLPKAQEDLHEGCETIPASNGAVEGRRMTENRILHREDLGPTPSSAGEES
ncbi:hypothetical protein IEQ34_015219 [Dendrobium chrysotoxum]|uniref:Uncharacterized protein n=1 Tax=Dendrobium chrysotoxum TaxID=161865 RepID=A0AAV7GG40_DENCH|nr:hypothetical protein IEQ34_015219 [Dendrobium chrysotoxum]